MFQVLENNIFHMQEFKKNFDENFLLLLQGSKTRKLYPRTIYVTKVRNVLV